MTPRHELAWLVSMLAVSLFLTYLVTKRPPPPPVMLDGITITDPTRSQSYER